MLAVVWATVVLWKVPSGGGGAVTRGVSRGWSGAGWELEVSAVGHGCEGTAR